ncbi:MAG: XkdX family protein [Lachnospiraceae bacterium]|nr:XkdX family protein [Lachnospiraceae bacterium]MCM1232023.1 XkdX family protein [Ruminococcus flavefaciens]
MSSAMFNKINRYYQTGLWKIDRVSDIVTKKIITTDEFEQITGTKFSEEATD